MKKIILLILLSVGLSQVTLTDEEVIQLANNINTLQLQVDSLFIIDSLKTIEVDLLNEKIVLLEEENKLLEKKTKLVKPSWYENKWLYFGYGTILTYSITTLIDRIESVL